MEKDLEAQEVASILYSMAKRARKAAARSTLFEHLQMSTDNVSSNSFSA